MVLGRSVLGIEIFFIYKGSFCKVHKASVLSRDLEIMWFITFKASQD